MGKNLWIDYSSFLRILETRSQIVLELTVALDYVGR